MELARGLASELPVVPILVGGAAMPTVADLPPDLSQLADRQAVVVRDEAFHEDVERLLRSLRGRSSSGQPGHRGRLIALVAAVIVVVGGGLVTWIVQGRSGEAGSTNVTTSGLGSCQDPSTPEWNRIAVEGKPSAAVSHTGGSVTITVNGAHWRPTSPVHWQLVLTTQVQNDTREDLNVGAWFYRDVEVAQRPFDPSCFSVTRKEIAAGEVVDGLVGFEVSCRPDDSVVLVLQSSTSADRYHVPITVGTPSSDCRTDAL